MPSYCSLSDLKAYLNITASTDDALLQSMLDAATSRIDAQCARTFQAASDTTRYFDPTRDLIDDELMLDYDLSYLTSLSNGGEVVASTYLYHNPRNATPYYALGLKSTAPYSWTSAAEIENSIGIVGRWAYMERAEITAISRSALNVVTATANAPRLSVGQSVFVMGVADTGFNGVFTVTANNGAAITWAQTAGADTDTTGTILFTPTDIVTACRRLAAWMYRQKDTQMGDSDRPIITGDGTVIMPSTLPQDVTSLLRLYVRRL